MELAVNETKFISIQRGTGKQNSFPYKGFLDDKAGIFSMELAVNETKFISIQRGIGKQNPFPYKGFFDDEAVRESTIRHQ